jgi:hypothetical protein
MFSQRWLAIVHDVLHADWQDAWHSPQALFPACLRSTALTATLMCFILASTLLLRKLYPNTPACRRGWRASAFEAPAGFGNALSRRAAASLRLR